MGDCILLMEEFGMTEKRFWCLDEYKGETSPIVDGKFAPTNGWLCDKLNELHEENQRLNQTLENIQKELNKYNNEWVDL